MIGKVLSIAKGGAGIIHDAGRTIFVPGVIAGETVEISLLGRKRSVWEGKLQQVLEASPQRCEPPCPHYRECGGCNLQHMSYAEQVRSKTKILAANLEKISGLAPSVLPEALASPPWRYRSKSEFQVRDGVGGFFRKESHQVVSISRCLLVPETVEAFFLAERQSLGRQQNAQLQILSNGQELSARLESAAGGETWLSKERKVRFSIGAFAYQFAPDNFIQANLFQLQPMLDLLGKTLRGMNGATAADLFCGCGFFTLPLAASCRNVVALESEPRNLAALRANLALNRAENVKAVQADVLNADLPPADLYVVDPPRGGLSARAIAAMASQAGIVVYFSCDSATFARDLSIFDRHGFRLDELKLVDNFPQSDHFEIFSVLKRK
jgi:23S rRNA (uracil1939-C5)-methyltransferase